MINQKEGVFNPMYLARSCHKFAVYKKQVENILEKTKENKDLISSFVNFGWHVRDNGFYSFYLTARNTAKNKNENIVIFNTRYQDDVILASYFFSRLYNTWSSPRHNNKTPAMNNEWAGRLKQMKNKFAPNAGDMRSVSTKENLLTTYSQWILDLEKASNAAIFDTDLESHLDWLQEKSLDNSVTYATFADLVLSKSSEIEEALTVA
jgi:hypothetical protein